jgi:glycosyltransferase involved in cell wall biosynthesis
MKVALYYPWIYLTSGAERTILELTRHSRHEWTILTNRYDEAGTFPELRSRNIRQLGTVSVRRTVSGAAQGALRILTQKLPLEGYDALLIICEGFGDLALVRNRSVPAICLCLTPLRVVFDSAYKRRCLEMRGPMERWLIRAGSAAFLALDRLLWKQYQKVFCISEEVRRRVLQGRLAPAEKLQVTHVGLGFQPAAPSTRFDRFFLIAGRIMWTKYIEIGIEGFLEAKRLNPECADFRLVVAGKVDTKSRSYLEKLQRIAGEGNGIELRTEISDSELGRLYQTCYATLFTAFNEDWGIVPLESMAFGKPVIAVNRGGPMEYMIDGENGLLVEPGSAEFAGAVSRLMREPDLCRRMGEAGVRTSAEFSWKPFTDVIDNAVERIAQRQPHRIPVAATEPESLTVRAAAAAADADTRR